MLDIRIDDKLGRFYHVCMVDRPNIPSAVEKVEFIDIPGRENGSLTKKNGYEDVEFTINFNSLEDENIKPLLRKIKKWLRNAKILSFTDDNVYRKIKSVAIGNIDNQLEEYGQFEVTFKSDPYEYIIEQPIDLTMPMTVMNYGTLHSLPKFTITGSGTVTIYVNGLAFQIKDIVNSVVVDSDLLLCYSGSFPMNNKMIGNFPVLKEGENEILWTGTVSKIELEVRGRYV
ncbi:phage tail domain-containing protein [Bacillus toyonensis]|uniref:phage tail domain-containing protein n=1 Tax=Bacillus toyonensis TaxID=155322 RepID=UPI001C029EAF|nr:phage tail domain-containing protein [Bacillus toyonensis]QWG94640.1 phage tail protein [Bacillus toyonensis]